MVGAQDKFRGFRHPFVYGILYFGGIGDYPRTLIELAMSEFSSEVRRIPQWWTQFQDPIVRTAWAKMAQERIWNIRTSSSAVEIKLSERQIQYTLDELAGYATLHDEENGCQVSCFERIWESDFAHSTIGLSSMTKQLASLHSQTPTHRSGDVSTALIDPYLYCLVYKRTFIPESCLLALQGHSVPSQEHYTVSLDYAFLPAEVEVTPDGTASFKSYINNLRPETFPSLYLSLSDILSNFIPLFEHTLTDLHRNNPLYQRIPGPCKYLVWDEPEEPEYSDDEEGWANFERELRHWTLHRPIHLPDVPESGYPGGIEDRRHNVSLRGRDIQVIVALDEIRLEPGGPSYQGSQWHVEGMRNERIVACGEYIISMENITSSALEFRMAVAHPRGYAAGDNGATIRTWGLDDGAPCHQYIGTRPITQGLKIVFPNIYQHRQTPFSLLDPECPGYLTVIKFWLVDPEIETVISTSNVAPQQKTWVRAALEDAIGHRLPAELLDHILQHVEGLMDEHEADLFANALKGVRERFRNINDIFHFCIPFDISRGTIH